MCRGELSTVHYPGNVSVTAKWVEMAEGTYKMGLPLPLLSRDSWMLVKENPDRKKKPYLPINMQQK